MSNIVENRKASHDYFIEDRYEAGLMLEGWEVKAIRKGLAQITEAYVIVKESEIFLFGAHISPVPTMRGFISFDPTRTRKLLLHKHEITKLIGKVTRQGYTIVPVNLHYSKGRIKCTVGLAKGKKQADRREVQKDKDTKREVERYMKQNTR